jgi:hypothetical protein
MHQTPEALRNIFSPGLLRDLDRQIKEQFPDAETISGTRVSGARGEKGGRTSIDIEAASRDDPAHIEPLRDVFQSGDWRQFTPTTEGLIKPTAEWTAKEDKIFNDVMTLFERILPPWARTIATHGIRGIKTRREVGGLYAAREGMQPLILWSLMEDDAIGIGRHEAIHFLRRQGFISKDEWNVLVDASIKGKWIEKHDIWKRYLGKPFGTLIEEYIA